MSHEKHGYFKSRGQTSSSPKRNQTDYLCNKRLPTPSRNYDVDVIGGSSRKRKSTFLDVRGAESGYFSPWESYVQEFSSHVGINGKGSKHGMNLNQSKSAEQVISRHQFNNHQFLYQNDKPLPAGNENFHGNVIRTNIISDASSSMPTNVLQYERPLSLNKMSVGENIVVTNKNPGACYFPGRNEDHSSLPSESCNAGTDTVRRGFNLQDVLMSGINNFVVPNNIQLEFCNTAPELLRLVDNVHQEFGQPNRFSKGFNGSSCSEVDNRYGIPCELRQSGLCSNSAGISCLPSVGIASFGALVTEQIQNHKTLQDEAQLSGSPLGIDLGNSYAINEQGPGNGNIKTQKITAASEMQKSKSSLTKDFSLESGGSSDHIGGNSQNNDLNHVPSKIDGNSKLASGKPSAVAKKLWDGRVQLSSSVTVSAIAFFKSGEKLPDINWSDFVEVKGKVRLEAFEKYIQDLPRSRNRGLMVISLCWKEGSDETGLTGMKEVAKGYKKGGRVGFAQLSTGNDLYICPRSDTIITILAKYGFFKGMAAIEDNQDSLIGCVVWRKNRLRSNSIAQIKENKNNALSEQHLDSVSGSLAHQVAERKLSPTQQAQQSNQFTPLVAVASIPSLDSAVENGRESKNIGTSQVHLEVGNSSYSTSALLTCSVPGNDSSVPVGQQMSVHSYGAQEGLNRHLSEAEACGSVCSGVGQSKFSLGKKNPAISVQSNSMKSTIPTSDEDDLPDYDFGTACGISATSAGKHIDASTPGTKLQAERNYQMDGSVPLTMPIPRAISAPHQRSGNIILPGNHSAAKQGIPMPKNVCPPDCKNPQGHNSEEKPSVQSKTASMSHGVSAFASTKNSCNEFPKKKKLFDDDDDDDMPEWWPPELNKQSLGEVNRSSTIISSEIPNLTFKNISPGLPRPVIPPPPAAPSSQFSYQPFRPALHYPIAVSAKAPQGPQQTIPNQSSSSFPMGFNSTPILRPQSGLVPIRPPFQFSNRRDWS